MYIHCTAGVTQTNLVGDLPGYGTMWFHPDRIANILSLSRVKTKYRITFDSDTTNEFIVHKPDGSTRNLRSPAVAFIIMIRPQVLQEWQRLGQHW